MHELHVICVGKLKDKNLRFIETEYTKRLKLIKLTIYEVKAERENLLREEQNIIKKIASINSSKNTKSYTILMTEQGTILDSKEFSALLFNHFEKQINTALILVIGGASGFGSIIKEKADAFLSLSSLTFPHRIARLILIEQIYRAETIFQNHPYHK